MLRFGLDRHFLHYCRTGEPRSLARVFDGAAPELYRLGYHLLGDRHAAEDLVQQTFVAAIETRASFSTERRVMPWLCGIYRVTADDKSFGAVHVGAFTVPHGAVIDAGTFTVPTPGRLEVEIVDSTGRRRLDGWLQIQLLGPPDARRNGGLRHDQGLATGNVQPGRWRIESWQPMPFAAIQCEVLPGRTTRTQLMVPDGQRFVLRVPSSIEEPLKFTMFWRDDRGEVLRQTQVPMGAPGTNVDQFAAPGTYTLTVRAPDGAEATTKVTIPSGGAPPVVVELPVPTSK